jgi:hypothetical protein
MQTHDYIHRYRGYWSDGGKCRIRIYQEEGQNPLVICSQLLDNVNTSVTNMAEYLAAEVIEEHGLATPLTWIEHYPEHREKLGEYFLVRFSSWEPREVRLGGVWRYRVGSPRWSPWCPEEIEELHYAAGKKPNPLAREVTTDARWSEVNLKRSRVISRDYRRPL